MMITHITRALSVLCGYGTGMALYRRDNCERNHWHIFKVNIMALMDELVEAFDELWHFRCLAFFFEICDVWHTLVVLMIRTFLPRSVHKSKFIWLITFFVAGVITPWKHGARFIDYGCIRSFRHCQQGDHKCSNNKHMAK
jgi:hypothetical protein